MPAPKRLTSWNAPPPAPAASRSSPTWARMQAAIPTAACRHQPPTTTGLQRKMPMELPPIRRPAAALTTPPPWVDYPSTGETPVAGSVSNTYMATHSDTDGAWESITERQSGGKPQNRYAYLEHHWNFNVGAGVTVTVFAKAWRSGSNASESFNLEYSTNGGATFQPVPLMIISSTSSGNIQSANIPDAPSGSITLRVRDNQQQSGNTTLSTFNVDHLYIRVYSATGEPPPAYPPAAPSGMTAVAASSSAINLGWTDASNDELGFRVERSPDGLTGWVEIADLAAGTTKPW